MLAHALAVVLRLKIRPRESRMGQSHSKLSRNSAAIQRELFLEPTWFPLPMAFSRLEKDFWQAERCHHRQIFVMDAQSPPTTAPFPLHSADIGRACWDLAQQSIRQARLALLFATKRAPNKDGCVPHAKAAIRFRRHFAITPLACDLINHPAPVRHRVPAPQPNRLRWVASDAPLKDCTPRCQSIRDFGETEGRPCSVVASCHPSSRDPNLPATTDLTQVDASPPTRLPRWIYRYRMDPLVTPSRLGAALNRSL